MKERNDLANRLNVLKTELDEKCTDISNLHTLVAKIQDDKAKLSKKISNLLENGNYLNNTSVNKFSMKLK